jgi:hypothetical protein
MIPKFLIISLFQTLMIFQQTIYQNFIHILIISQYDSQKLHLQDHPIRLRQWQLRTLCLKELPELGVWPRSAPHRVIRVFIIFEFNIYIFIFICDYIYICMYIYIYIYICT